jgi:hypothetical protein
MPAAEDAGIEPILPEVADFALAHVPPTGIIAVGPAQGARQSGVRLGNCEQVNVIPHQAVSGDPHRVAHAMMGEQFQVHRAVEIAIEHRLPAIPALSDVMPTSGGNYPCNPRH